MQKYGRTVLIEETVEEPMEFESLRAAAHYLYDSDMSPDKPSEISIYTALLYAAKHNGRYKNYLVRVEREVTHNIKPNWGYIYTRCPICGGMNRVLVTFPAFNKPFNPRTYECHMCGANNLASDPHKYDDDGHIIDSDYFSDIDKAEIHKAFVEDY